MQKKGLSDKFGLRSPVIQKKKLPKSATSIVPRVWASCATLYRATPPYTAPRLNAAYYGAMGMGVLGDAFLCYPPRLG